MRRLLRIAAPPPYAYVRSAIRLTVGGGFWLAGYQHIGTVFAVLAAISFFGTIEAQVAKAIAGKYLTSDSWITKALLRER